MIHDDSMASMTGTPSMDVSDGIRASDGARDYSIHIEREGASIDVAMLFEQVGETFDPGMAIAFARQDTPDHEEPLLVGDAIVMRCNILK